MDVRGYEIGPINASGAFTSEIDIPVEATPGLLSTAVEADRPSVVRMPGMRHKYLPVRFDPATGALTGGGCYLFDTYANAVAFRNFLESCIMEGESTTFWNRPWFVNPVRFAWRVYGAFDFTPITTHHLNRIERYAVPEDLIEASLPQVFQTLLEEAQTLGLGHVSLMYQPEQRLLGVVTAAARKGDGPNSFETVRNSIDALALRGSISENAFRKIGAREKVFDRTSLTLTIYLPKSEEAGGVPAIWPNSPPIPLPGDQSQT